MKNNNVALWILLSIVSPTTLTRNLGREELTKMKYSTKLLFNADMDIDNRKLSQSQTTHTVMIGLKKEAINKNSEYFEQGIPEGQDCQEDWDAIVPPTDVEWIQNYHNKD